MGKISPNFDLNEFTQTEVSGERLYLLTALALNILEPLRGFLGCPVHITNAVRSPADYQRLVDLGYHPSETSDHFYDNPIKIMSDDKRKIWGDYYTCGVGAADIVPACGSEQAWQKLLPYLNKVTRRIELPVPRTSIEVGQVIHEYNPDMNWIHVANPPSIKFSQKFIDQFLTRPCFLTSADKGVTYQEI